TRLATHATRGVLASPSGCRTRYSRPARTWSSDFLPASAESSSSLTPCHAVSGGGSGRKFVCGGTPVVSALLLLAKYPTACGTVTAAPPVAYAIAAEAPVSTVR